MVTLQALVRGAGEVQRGRRRHVLEAQVFEEAPDVVDAVLGIGLPAFGNVTQHEVPVRGNLLAHRDHRAARMGDLGGTQALAVDAGDDAVQPVDDLVSAGDRALDEPRLRVAGHVRM